MFDSERLVRIYGELFNQAKRRYEKYPKEFTELYTAPRFDFHKAASLYSNDDEEDQDIYLDEDYHRAIYSLIEDGIFIFPKIRFHRYNVDLSQRLNVKPEDAGSYVTEYKAKLEDIENLEPLCVSTLDKFERNIIYAELIKRYNDLKHGIV